MILNEQTNNDLLPIEIDASFRYRCSCGIDHWLYLREVIEDNFFTVCFCQKKLYPKTIKLVDIIYKENITKKEQIEVSDNIKNKSLDKSVDRDIIERCANAMLSFGLTLKESKEYLLKAYSKSEYTNDTDLIKAALLEI